MEVFNMTHVLSRDSCSSENDILCGLLYFFLTSLMTVTTGGNFLVIISIIYFKQLHTPTNYLILSLALADLLIGVLILPFSILLSHRSCAYEPRLVCNVRDSFDVMISISSILNMCCISIDRYYAVCQPLLYTTKITDHVAVCMSLGSWSVAVVSGIVYFGMIVAFHSDTCEELECLLFGIFGCICIFYLPTAVLLSIYTNILLVALRQARSIQNITFQSGPSTSKKERKATRTMAVVIGVFIICWMPLFILQPLYYLNNIKRSLFELLNWFALSNSMFNPFIYAFFYSWFRSAIRMIISGKIFQGDFANAKLQ